MADDLDCDGDFGDCDCDCDCDGDCCCCSGDGDCGSSLRDKFCCLICININNATRHDQSNLHNHSCCCWCCYDDYNYPRQSKPMTQTKQESDPKIMMKQKEEENKRRMESKQESSYSKIMKQEIEGNNYTRKEGSEWEHEPSCPYCGSRISRNRCPCNGSASFDLDPPFIQRFETLDRENYRRGYMDHMYVNHNH